MKVKVHPQHPSVPKPDHREWPGFVPVGEERPWGLAISRPDDIRDGRPSSGNVNAAICRY